VKRELRAEIGNLVTNPLYDTRVTTSL
jgi:hypothetical protein